MAFWTIPFNNVSTGNNADTADTMVSAIVPDTAGSRIRVRAISIGAATDSPTDVPFGVKLQRIADVSAGAAGTAGSSITAANIPKHDSLQADAPCSAGIAYTAEPTTYETHALWQTEMNARDSLIKEWLPDEAPVASRDQLMGLLVTPRTAVALIVSGSMTVESF